jgi:hypothetical protein
MSACMAPLENIYERFGTDMLAIVCFAAHVVTASAYAGSAREQHCANQEHSSMMTSSMVGRYKDVPKMCTRALGCRVRLYFSIT